MKKKTVFKKKNLFFPLPMKGHWIRHQGGLWAIANKKSFVVLEKKKKKKKRTTVRPPWGSNPRPQG
jgi:hypothetical protein